MSQSRKAVALISGGLDSMLAAKTIMDQGIHVEGINFFTGFCVEGHTHAIRKQDSDKVKRNNALWVAEQLGIKLHIIDIIDEYKQVLLNPKHGYGANLNPCLDCKIFMVNKAKQWMQQNDFDFIITGEVVGQRPMSQRKMTMPIVAAESGADDLLVRPLSAQNLPATLPEREGWITRAKLFGFSGRSRKPQMTLASQLGFTDYAQPAGGCCFLTDASYSKKLVDLWQARGKRDYELDDVMLLKVGRHIRPSKNFKLIIAREDGEAQFMSGYKKQFISMNCASHRGPLVLIDGAPDENDLQLAARITARYGQGRDAEQVDVTIRDHNGNERNTTVKPLHGDDIPETWFV
ncbi:MAG: tRNA (5-methylaminomethyl-2-thiouridylate)-methyltransferase [Methylomonas sp.]|nr:MAG: tRNA (5-methylaminomethyl-2-thiouridylate)-methyltransferase [Methylomonas sp.]PPD27011.1 MAG: tRNA (5-methylaminomethyl-2-thiouridylate)-methyltransferase [Methylomonas sp.]PPD38949.1 MAG: tRNA (5-methylaminomethyl-2-thiouridylate)-methyltransferase [Methylomonas sp.]PPD42604.1 MAG: tRNA (5-methylaminomethyl-2-thiouridylate)-methyltransferase [Methylomonas sp.]PPD54213.1 MAG: tRNA (5-methylaminomethyl-2-thiouridylate)-methyltransferase [Methylomonas sp.]